MKEGNRKREGEGREGGGGGEGWRGVEKNRRKWKEVREVRVERGDLEQRRESFTQKSRHHNLNCRATSLSSV